MMESVGAKNDTTCTFNVHSIIVLCYCDCSGVCNRPVRPGTRGPDQWIVYPVPFCRFYYPNRKFYYNKLWRVKQDWQEDLPLEMANHFVRYALPTKLGRCNDHAVDTSPSPSGLRNRVRLCQDWQLVCLSFYFRAPGYPTVTGIGYPVPKISVNARA